MALGIGVDVLPGVSPPRRPKRLATNHLGWRLMEIEKLGIARHRQLIQIIDTFIEHGKLKQRVNTQETAL